MADVLEQVRIWRRRIRRRRWLGVVVAWAICALGWTALALLGKERSALGAALALSAVLVTGMAAGSVAAALVARREPVFDSLAQLRRAFERPVLGSVADASAASSARADLGFALACIGLLGTFTGLLLLQPLAPEGP